MGQFLHEFFSPLDFIRADAAVWNGFIFNLKLMLVAEALVLAPRPIASRSCADCPGAQRLPLRAVGDRLRRLLPRDAADPRPLDRAGFRAARLRRALGRDRCSRYGLIALVLVYTAYVSEVYRAGIESVHPSQRMAARSLGLELHADDALRRAAAGDPPRRPAAPQRLHRPAEGHRAGHLHRPDRGGRAGRPVFERLLQRHRATSSPRCSSSSSRSRSRASPTTSSSSASGANGRRSYEHERPLRLAARRPQEFRRSRGPARDRPRRRASTTSSA